MELDLNKYELEDMPHFNLIERQMNEALNHLSRKRSEALEAFTKTRLIDLDHTFNSEQDFYTFVAERLTCCYLGLQPGYMEIRLDFVTVKEPGILICKANNKITYSDTGGCSINLRIG